MVGNFVTAADRLDSSEVFVLAVREDEDCSTMRMVTRSFTARARWSVKRLAPGAPSL